MGVPARATATEMLEGTERFSAKGYKGLQTWQVTSTLPVPTREQGLDLVTSGLGDGHSEVLRLKGAPFPLIHGGVCVSNEPRMDSDELKQKDLYWKIRQLLG